MVYEIDNNLIRQKRTNLQHVDAVIEAENETYKKIQVPLCLNGNMLVNGTTRYGKSSFIKGVIKQVCKNNPDALIVFFDIKDDYISEFYEEGDKIMSYSMNRRYDNQFKLNLMKEIRLSEEPDAEIRTIADILWQDVKENSREGYFSDASMETFIGFLSSIYHTYSDCPANKVWVDALKNMEFREIIRHINRWSPNLHITRDHLTYTDGFKMTKQSQGVMGVLSQVLPLFDGNFCSVDGDDTIHEFLEGKYGSRLFLEYDYSKQASSNAFFRFVLKKIIQDKLSQNANKNKKVFLVLDEVAVLNGDFSLMDALTIGAGNNLNIIVGTQSIEKLHCISPERNREHITNASLAGYATVAAFHPGDPFTIDTLQKFFGEKNKQLFSLGLSRYDAPTVTIQKEPIVSNEELSLLDVGECYIKTKNNSPIKIKVIL